MADQSFGYPYNNHAQNYSTYPPRSDQSSDEYKHPYDNEIIESYATAEVPLPGHQRTPPYPPSVYPQAGMMERHNPSDYYLGAKPSYSSAATDNSDIQSPTYKGGGGGYGGSVAVLEKQEKRSFWQRMLPDSMACRLYVLTVFIETCIDIGIEADLLLRFQAMDEEPDLDMANRRLPVYLSIFAFAHIFQLVMAIDAVHMRNTLQFMFLTVFNALVLIYAIIQIFEIRESVITSQDGISDLPVHVLTIIIPIVMGVAEIAYIALGWKIWTEFGWKVYKQLGADRQVKRMYAHYQIFICLIKFDVFFFVGFSVQLIWLVLNRDDWEWYVTCAALPGSFILLALGHLAARYENKPMMGTFMLGCIGAMVYFVYKLVKISQFTGNSAQVVKSLTVFAVIAIFLLLATFIVSIMVMRNFGGGLKYHMSKQQRTPSLRRRGTEHQLRHRSYPLGHNPNRMSIE